jgi:hypothetical protein
LELARSRRNPACLGLLLAATLELTSFAGTSLASFPMAAPYSPSYRDFLAQHPGDYRVLHDNPNAAMTVGTQDVEGNDPSGLLRYRRFMNFVEGLDLDAAPFSMPPQNFDTNALRMVRCRYLISGDEKFHLEVPGVLPHLLLAERFRVLTNCQAIFATLTNAGFNMEEEVILESQPSPLPQPATHKGTVKLLDSSTDFLKIEADVPAPALLLITDSYSSGWRALALPGSVQPVYKVMPASYCLRAIPLAAGHHLLRVEYSPKGFRIGKRVSIAAWIVFLLLSVLVARLGFSHVIPRVNMAVSDRHR